VVELEAWNFPCETANIRESGHWSDSQNVWVLESGWVRDFPGDGSIERYSEITATALTELTEPPSYFNREVRQAFQLSSASFGNYIEELRLAGFDVSALTAAVVREDCVSADCAREHAAAIPYDSRGARGAIGAYAWPRGSIAYFFAGAVARQPMGGVGANATAVSAAFATGFGFLFSGNLFLFSRCHLEIGYFFYFLPFILQRILRSMPRRTLGVAGG